MPGLVGAGLNFSGSLLPSAANPIAPSGYALPLAKAKAFAPLDVTSVNPRPICDKLSEKVGTAAGSGTAFAICGTPPTSCPVPTGTDIGKLADCPSI